MKKYFEEFKIGEKSISQSRKMTNADINLFIDCSGDDHPIHSSLEYCKNHPLVKKCVVQGVLVLGVADGMMAREIMPNEVYIFHYGSNSVRFIRPVYSGDFIHIETEVTDKKIKNSNFGLVYFKIYVVNQDGDAVVFYEDIQMIQRQESNLSAL